METSPRQTTDTTGAPFSSLLRRFTQYSSVGVSTFVVDLLLIYIFKTYFGFSDIAAISLGFAIAVTINFFGNYYWVFRGTPRTRLTAYFMFVGLAGVGLGVVLIGTLFIHNWLMVNIYLARSIVAGAVGMGNFLANAFFNFRVAYHE